MNTVVVVGAGPAGLFVAQELATDYDVKIIERSDYVGGSGLHSDSKLNFHPNVGGDLTEFIPEEEAWGLVEEIHDIFTALGVEPARYDESGLSQLEARAAKAAIKFVKIRQNHIGSDHLHDVMGRMRRTLEEHGVDIILGRNVTRIVVEGERVVSVETDDGPYPADVFLLAPGRSGSGWLIDR